MHPNSAALPDDKAVVSASNGEMSEDTIVSRETGDIRPRFLPRWLGYLAVLSAVAGLMLLVTGYLMPAYTDSVAAERIRSGAECKRGVPNTNEDRQCETDQWYRSMNAVRTNKWSLVDAGGGLLLSGLTVGS